MKDKEFYAILNRKGLLPALINRDISIIDVASHINPFDEALQPKFKLLARKVFKGKELKDGDSLNLTVKLTMKEEG